MGFSKMMVTFILVATLAISFETVQAAPPRCGQNCTERFLTQDCDKYCVGLSYKRGVCILSEGRPPKTSTYRCCCS
ncbi:putative defensin-like protein 66 [Capsella rubella]|uniref:putative defensin-like protein 66 n=1 Tax=Capsella rubella TaxID=81985 RepID=UPI000CD52F1F|nr:putative defensin-like protein 66 [Capsella rubella]